jgi:hypothetical protein
MMIIGTGWTSTSGRATDVHKNATFQRDTSVPVAEPSVDFCVSTINVHNIILPITRHRRLNTKMYSAFFRLKKIKILK